MSGQQQQQQGESADGAAEEKADKTPRHTPGQQAEVRQLIRRLTDHNDTRTVRRVRHSSGHKQKLRRLIKDVTGVGATPETMQGIAAPLPVSDPPSVVRRRINERAAAQETPRTMFSNLMSLAASDTRPRFPLPDARRSREDKEEEEEEEEDEFEFDAEEDEEEEEGEEADVGGDVADVSFGSGTMEMPDHVDDYEVEEEEEEGEAQNVSVHILRESGEKPPHVVVPAPASASVLSAEAIVPRRGVKRRKETGELPRSSVRKLFMSLAGGMKVSRAAVDRVLEASDKFFAATVDTAVAYAQHAKRKTIEPRDMLLLMQRQRVISKKRKVQDVARGLLPRELLDTLAPAAVALETVPEVVEEEEEEEEE